MKKNYVLPLLLIASIGGLAVSRSADAKIEAYAHSHVRYASGPPAGQTGAPDESNCTSCHTGQVQDGDAINEFQFLDADLNEVTSYTPGATYTVHFTVNNPATKKGFQTVALTSSLAQAGSMTASPIGGTIRVVSGGRHYISHNSSSNTTTMGWGFTWTAPATNVGNVKFYVASNVTNNSGTNSGDVIYTSDATLTPNSTSGITEKEGAMDLSAGYAASTQTINLSFNSRISGAGFMNLVDLNGKSVYSAELNSVKIGGNTEKVLLPSDIKSGIYIVHLFVNNQSTTHKLMIQK
jgi:hypothetical protein